MDNINWHIEPTSKCILECPLCDRTWFYKKFKKREIHEINIDHLLKFFNGVPYAVSFCGNNGDPIYHSKFNELCSRLKQSGCKIHITTNGSKKSADWWKKLGSMLTVDDKITFSIDGLRNTNKIYRINSDWESIINGFKIIKKHNIKTEWKFIVFRHNQHQIREAKTLSKQLGFDNFLLEKSDRWWDETLMPDKKFVDTKYQHQKTVITKKKLNGVMSPKCLKKGIPTDSLYIDSAGDFYPCCWTGLYAFKYKDMFDPKQKKFNIKDHNVNSILTNNKVQEFFTKIKDYESASHCCKIYCGVNNG
jgi:MoaA/NifB/PqqE/SkfB family radical SAM enzyme